MNVKAIMCDIDGTLLSSEGVVTKKTVEMIKKAREKGTLFGLSTGRDVNSIQTLLGTWGIEGLVDMIVGTGGAEIYDYTLDISKAQYPLDGDLIKEIVKHYEDMDCNFAIPEDGIFIHQRMMNIFKIFLKGIEFLIRLLIIMNI
ncbi:HAD family hydrolase [Faecalibacillus intestinalis]|uniref:HAD family hydrolase n=1 Tax=Faecalibacillus intestinalis TaxID=1982626 RepID=UPI002FDB5E65